MRIFCKIDGRDGLIVGAGPGYREVKDGRSTSYVPCTKLLVILAGEKFIQAVNLGDAELYGMPKKMRKLHKKLLRRSQDAVVEGVGQ